MIKYYIFISPVYEYVLFILLASFYFFVFPVLRFLLRYPMTINIKYKIVHTSQITYTHTSTNRPTNIIIQPSSLLLSD